MRSFYFICVVLLALGNLAGCNKTNEPKDELVPVNEGATSDKALLAANEAIQKNPNSAAAYATRAKLYLSRTAYAQALADANQALKLDSTQGSFYFLKAKALRGQNQVPAALKTALKAEAKGYADAELYLSMGEMFLIIKQYQKAISALNKSLELAQFNEQAYFYKGLVYLESADTNRAISSFQTAIEQAPSYIDPYNTLIKIYNARKDRKMAEQYIRSGLRFAPENAFLWFNQGVVFEQQGKPDTAIYSYKTALGFDSSLYLARYNLGVLAYKQGNYTDAAPALQRVLAYKNIFPGVEGMLAYSYEKLGNFAAARQYYQEALKAAPSDPELVNGLVRVQKNTEASTAKAQSK